MLCRLMNHAVMPSVVDPGVPTLQACPDIMHIFMLHIGLAPDHSAVAMH